MRTVNRLILFGSIVLGIVAILPFIAEYLTYHLTGLKGLRLSIGGTGVLIVVSVDLETFLLRRPGHLRAARGRRPRARTQG